MILTLIAVFYKLYVFRQNLGNFNILVERLYGRMLHDLVVIITAKHRNFFLNKKLLQSLCIS